jgi:hypothetical protein
MRRASQVCASKTARYKESLELPRWQDEIHMRRSSYVLAHVIQRPNEIVTLSHWQDDW